MKKLVKLRNIRKQTSALLLLIAFFISGSLPPVFAHGGEDHGESKPKSTADVKGIVSHMARLGNLELMVKHSALEPDTVSTGRLFVTNFQTNAPADKISPVAEIESANGSVTPITIEKTDSAGSYNLKIPALQTGTYTLRTKVTYSGETDTATFSGVEVKTAPVASKGNMASWSRTALIALSGLVILGLFGGLIYFAIRAARGGRAREEAVTA